LQHELTSQHEQVFRRDGDVEGVAGDYRFVVIGHRCKGSRTGGERLPPAILVALALSDQNTSTNTTQRAMPLHLRWTLIVNEDEGEIILRDDPIQFFEAGIAVHARNRRRGSAEVPLVHSQPGDFLFGQGGH
jgi:hypothetical protein